MNFKRKRPQNARAGCKWCKPWKMNHGKHKRPAREPVKERDYVNDGN